MISNHKDFILKYLPNLLTVIAALSLSIPPLFGLPQTPLGSNLQLNAYTTGNQTGARIAAAADGGFVVVWNSIGSAGNDPDYSVQVRRFLSDGSGLGEDFQVNTYTSDDQWRPSVGISPGGDFVAVWQSTGSPADDNDISIQGRRFASDGSAQGDQFQINEYTTASQAYPAVALDGDGNFIVVWASFGGVIDTDSASIQARRYQSDGTPSGGQFLVNHYTTSYQISPAVAMNSTGSFIVSWVSDGSFGTDNAETSIQARRFSSDGSPLGDQFQVNEQFDLAQFNPSTAMNENGEFIVVWNDFLSLQSSSNNIQGMRFDSSGAASGNQFQINTYSTGSQQWPQTTMGDTHIVVTWQSEGSPGTHDFGQSIQARRLMVDGSPLGDQFQVNTFTMLDQTRPSVSSGPQGSFVVWSGFPPQGSTYEIYGQRYAHEIFKDGFESGDLSAWSTTIPLSASPLF